jgi:hypothetical protein
LQTLALKHLTLPLAEEESVYLNSTAIAKSAKIDH